MVIYVITENCVVCKACSAWKFAPSITSVPAKDCLVVNLTNASTVGRANLNARPKRRARSRGHIGAPAVERRMGRDLGQPYEQGLTALRRRARDENAGKWAVAAQRAPPIAMRTAWLTAARLDGHVSRLRPMATTGC